MAYIVKSGNGKGTCGHHHTTVSGAMACRQHIQMLALREVAMKWDHARVMDEQTGKLLRVRQPVAAVVVESVPAM